MSNLTEKHCAPCHGGVAPLRGDGLRKLSAELPDWKVIDQHHLARTFAFKDFKTALEFVNRVGGVAEQEGHHPNICFTWGSAKIETYTHAIDGLSENDFILAAKIDEAFLQRKGA